MPIPIPCREGSEGGFAGFHRLPLDDWRRPANNPLERRHKVMQVKIARGGDSMTTRRSFLKGAATAGIAFCRCATLEAARAQEPERRLPVMVKGKRIKTIDVHSHCLFQDAVNLMGDDARNVFVPVNGAENQYIVIAERLKQMDAMAIDMEVLSINPFWYRKERDTAAAIVKMQNEKLAELCAAQPDRFADRKSVG